MKQSVRFFAIGLFTASVLTLGFYLFSDSSNAANEDMTTDELIAKVEEAGYRVITDEEFISYSLYIDEKNEQAKSEEVKKDDEKADKKKEDKDKKKKDGKKDKKKDDKEKNKKNKDKKDSKKKKDKKKKDDVKKAKITIKSGDVLADIAEQLADKKIIKNKQKFIDYLEDSDYSSKIQLGTFEVNSDMSMKEIAKTLTTYPGD